MKLSTLLWIIFFLVLLIIVFLPEPEWTSRNRVERVDLSLNETMNKTAGQIYMDPSNPFSPANPFNPMSGYANPANPNGLFAE